MRRSFQDGFCFQHRNRNYPGLGPTSLVVQYEETFAPQHAQGYTKRRDTTRIEREREGSHLRKSDTATEALRSKASA